MAAQQPLPKELLEQIVADTKADTDNPLRQAIHIEPTEDELNEEVDLIDYTKKFLVPTIPPKLMQIIINKQKRIKNAKQIQKKHKKKR